MVRRLLILCCGVSVEMGCLLTNPPDLEEEIDHPPSIVLRDPVAPIVTIDTDSPVQTTSFTAVIHEANITQLLRYRWFLDFDVDGVPQCGLVRGFLAVYDELDETPEEREAVYNLDHRILGPAECHRLTLVVTDGGWREGEHAGCSEVEDGAHRALADWWILTYDQSSTIDDISPQACLNLARQTP